MTLPTTTVRIENPEPLTDAAIEALARLLIDMAEREAGTPEGRSL